MSADLIESANDFHVHVDLPGAENLDISVDNGVLSISAERKVMHEIDSDIAHTVERSSGRVRRSLILPHNADGDQAKAKYADGVLTITMPKKESSKRTKLRIE
jgi:HSP20 family protein